MMYKTATATSGSVSVSAMKMAIASAAAATGRTMEAALPRERDCCVTSTLAFVRRNELPGGQHCMAVGSISPSGRTPISHEEGRQIEY
jgi:hypothetical protein